MDKHLEAIRAATAPDATVEARAIGAAACRAILASLEATVGAPLAPSPALDMNTTVAAIAGALRHMEPEQLLDLAITRLKAALPAGVEVAPTKPLAFHMVKGLPIGIAR